jgi:hypothetical protein
MAAQHPLIGFVDLLKTAHMIISSRRVDVSRRWSSHAHGCGRSRRAFREDLRLRHLLEFRHGADPISPNDRLRHISVIQRAGACSDRKIWPTFSELALVGAVDRCSVAMDHLSRRTMAPAPDPHATCRLHNQAVGSGLAKCSQGQPPRPR